MDFELKDYQLDCLEKVTAKIDSGARHLSVVMTSGLEHKITSLFIAKKLSSEGQIRIAMVFGSKDALKQTKSDAEEFEVESVDFFCVDEFIGNDGKYQYIMLHDLSVYERKQLQKHTQNIDSITISFLAPVWYVGEENINPEKRQRLLHHAEKHSLIVCVYVTNEVLDIRDARYASKAENLFVRKENADTVNWLQQERDKTLKERDAVKKEQDNQLEAFRKTLEQIEGQIKEQSTRTELRFATAFVTNANYKEDEARIKELLNQWEEFEANKKESDEWFEEELADQDFYQELVSRYELSPSIIQKTIESIQNIRLTYKDYLESSDEMIKEMASKQLQDKVDKVVNDLVQSAIPKKDQNYFKEYLIGELTEEIWERMDDTSKTSLITAKCNYESMVKTEGSEKYDYSGVCLLVTKAIEVETAKRFFYYYQDYLGKKYDSDFCWPDALKKTKNGRITVMTDNDFTLGSVVSIFGLKRDSCKHGDETYYTVDDVESNNEFIEYASDCLFKFSDRCKVEDEMYKDCCFIEKVRKDYRNPAAHRDSLTITSAKECLEYVIDVQHMLRKMLSAMKI